MNLDVPNLAKCFCVDGRDLKIFHCGLAGKRLSAKLTERPHEIACFVLFELTFQVQNTHAIYLTDHFSPFTVSVSGLVFRVCGCVLS